MVRCSQATSGLIAVNQPVHYGRLNLNTAMLYLHLYNYVDKMRKLYEQKLAYQTSSISS